MRVSLFENGGLSPASLGKLLNAFSIFVLSPPLRIAANKMAATRSIFFQHPFTRHNNNNDKGCYIRLFIVFHLIIARLLINFHLNRNQISILSNDTVYTHIYLSDIMFIIMFITEGGGGGRKFVDTRV